MHGWAMQTGHRIASATRFRVLRSRDRKILSLKTRVLSVGAGCPWRINVFLGSGYADGLATFCLPLGGMGGMRDDVPVEAEEEFHAKAHVGHQDEQRKNDVSGAECQEGQACRGRAK